MAQRTDTWREQFSQTAADLIQIQRAFAGPEIAKEIMLRCFRRAAKRRAKSLKINEVTVCAVLQEMADEAGAFDDARRARLGLPVSSGA